MGYLRWYFENLKKQWPLTVDEKKDLKKIQNEIWALQGDLKTTYISRTKYLREQILWEIKSFSEIREDVLKKVWKRRRRALIGR